MKENKRGLEQEEEEYIYTPITPDDIEEKTANKKKNRQNKYEEEQKEEFVRARLYNRKPRKINKITKVYIPIFSVLSVIVTLVMLIVSYSSGTNNQKILEGRNESLQIYESTKDAVVEEIKAFLLVKDEESYNKAKSNANMTNSAIATTYKDEFNYTNILGAKGVSVVDAQYSLKNEKEYGDNRFKVYMLVKVTMEDDKYRLLNVVTTVKDTKITDVRIY